MGEAGSGGRAGSAIALAAVLLATSALCSAAPLTATANGAQPAVVSPLPESNYAVRPVCPPPSPGHFQCLALELEPLSAEARAHTHPLGMPRRPRITATAGASYCEPPSAAEGCYGLRPQDLHKAYELPTGASSEQTIAVVDAYNDPDIEADLGVYDEAFDLPACTHADGCFTKVNQEGDAGPLPEDEEGWAVEISLDVEIAHAICQSCHILLVEAKNEEADSFAAAEDTAIALGAQEITDSWGAPERDLQLPESALKHPGVAITAAAGDYGYDNWQDEYFERGADYPAASPFVVAVGGTRLELTAEGARTGETVWNGDGAGGSGCSERFEAPRWQQEVPDWPVGCEDKRTVADVSADADPYTGAAIYDSYTRVERERYRVEPFDWGTLGGTSLGSPLLAATFALAGGSGGVEYPAETLYERVLSETGSLHEVLSGSNGECATFDIETGLSSCTSAREATSCQGQRICLAGPGYNGPGGLGTPQGISAFQAPKAPLRAEQTVQITSTPPSSPTVLSPPYELQAKSSSGLPVSMSSRSPEVCYLIGADVYFKESGECWLDARQAGDAEYRSALSEQSVQVAKAKQTIDISSLPPSPATAGEIYAMHASASSGLAVEYTSKTESVCGVDLNEIYLNTSGTCTIVVVQRGDGRYQEARAEQSFEVGKATQQITFSSHPPSPARFGGAHYHVEAKASSDLPVSLASLTTAVCKLEEGSEVAFTAPGTCTIAANQSGNATFAEALQAEQSFEVAKALQKVTFGTVPPSTVTIGEGPFTVSAASSAELPVVISSATPTVCELEGEKVRTLAVGTCTIEVNQSGDEDYEAAPQAEDSFVVAKRAQTIRFTSNAPESVTAGGAPYVVTAEASSGLPVSFSAGAATVCEASGATIRFLAAGTCTIAASQEGNGEIAPATEVDQTVRVLPAPTASSILPGGSGGPLSSSPLGTTADSSFSLSRAPAVDRGSGTITFLLSVSQPGTLSWMLSFPNGTLGVLAASKRRCATGRVWLRGACRPAEIIFGKGALAVHAAEAGGKTVSFTVKPSAAAISALKAGERRGKALTVTASVSFQSSLGGSPATHRYVIRETLRSRHRPRRVG